MSIQDLPRWLELSDGTSTVQLSFYEALDYTQTYQMFGGDSVHRMLDGTGVKQTNWTKLRTTVSGSGGLPLGFSALDYSVVLAMKCAAYRAISSPSNIIAIPAARRVDSNYEPVGLKRVGGFYKPAPVVLVGNTATVQVDGSADSYMVQYFPLIQVLMNNPSESMNIITSSAGWSFTAEEN